jgi:hypothetical protein
MSITSIMSEVVDFRLTIGSRSPNSEWYHSALRMYRQLANGQKLQRERYALNELITAMTHEISVQELTLAYQVNGKLYAVHKLAKTGGIPNCLSTEALIGKGYSQTEWNSFPKFHVWVKTGIVHAPVL